MFLFQIFVLINLFHFGPQYLLLLLPDTCCELLKFFPAGSSGGIKHLKNISAPYAHLGLKYIPLGGVNEENMNDYLREEIIAAVGGSWIASRENINSNDWKQIKANAESAILNSQRTSQ